MTKSRGLRPNQGTGISFSPLYSTWEGMMGRCYQPNHASFKYYGARGIKVCEQWHDPMRFIMHMNSQVGRRPDGYTLDRIDKDGDYEPGNVRWASPSAQLANRRNAVVRNEHVETCTLCGRLIGAKRGRKIGDAWAHDRCAKRKR